jgi:sporulation protein YlmC with PRC-barrel domain
LDIRLDAAVLANDGTPVGRVSKVILEPSKGLISHLVVRNGPALGRGRLVPVDQVVPGETEPVRLTISKAELEAAPAFDEDDFVPLEYEDWPGPYSVSALPIVAWGRPYPVEGQPLAPPEPLAELPFLLPGAQPAVGDVVLAPGMRVLSYEGQLLGRVEDVLGDARTGRATYLVLGVNGEEGANRLVPVSWIREVRGSEIILVVGPRVVGHLAPYPERIAEH